MNCFFCDEPANLDDDQTYREVLSWVNGPKLDGPKLREQTGRVAHKDCVDKIVKGQHPSQEGIFDEPVEDFASKMGHPGGHYG